MTKKTPGDINSALTASPFPPGSTAWAMWLAQGHYADSKPSDRKPEETTGTVVRTRDKASEVVSPGWGEKD